MKLIVTTEKRFSRMADGLVVTDNKSSTGYQFWTRYLSVFDEVMVLGRLGDKPSRAGTSVEGQGVSFVPIPDYSGGYQFLCRRAAIESVLRGLIMQPAPTAFLVRAPATFGNMLIRNLVDNFIPYGLEIIGDPYDVFAPGVISHPFRPLLRAWSAFTLKRQVRSACAVSYVTARQLQKRYPSLPEAYTTNYSSIELPLCSFGSTRTWNKKPLCPKLIFVGSLAQLYKAPDVLLKAVASLIHEKQKVSLTILGAGNYLEFLRNLAADFGIQDQICFKGQVPSGKNVNEELDQADIFVLPSKTEGLPRAMIEAMARGLPCIGTSVGGIPELLEQTEIVPAGDSSALANKISELVNDPQRMSTLSEINILKAREYCSDVLQIRRNAFYKHLKTITNKLTQSKSLL